jgi:hypothetical protein
LGIDEEMLIRSLHFAGNYGQAKTTTVVGKLYGDIN